jgi:hypothetical protein
MKLKKVSSQKTAKSKTRFDDFPETPKGGWPKSVCDGSTRVFFRGSHRRQLALLDWGNGIFPA